ncbi:iron-sulfur cluster assembly protein [Mycobacterium botniense]|nr:iron-sulfur cluster assembly protein [Mycobacterium botniense]
MNVYYGSERLMCACRRAILEALAAVVDPELGAPNSDLPLVRSITADDGVVTLRLELPVSFCSPAAAHLVACDVQEALRHVDGSGAARVLFGEERGGDPIDAGGSTEGGAADICGPEAEHSLDKLRKALRRSAHCVAMERCVSALMQHKKLGPTAVHRLTLRDLPDDTAKCALIRHRIGLGLSICPNARVVVDDRGSPLPSEKASMQRLRFARSVRIFMEGDGEARCGLLGT